MVHIFISFFFFFFFQAEDGIRDLTVTGVQTCALPIFSGLRPPLCGPRSPETNPAPPPFERGIGLSVAGDHEFASPNPDRSEERRVGKECRSRWSPYH